MHQDILVDFPHLLWRPPADADVPTWAALIARTAAVETPAWYEREADLRQQVTSSKNPPARNIVLGIDQQGVPRAYARVSKNPEGDKAHGFGCVDPEWQRRGVGTALLGWLEARARQRFGEDAAICAQALPRLRIHTEQQHSHQASLLESAGYTIIRYFHEMHRPLTPPLPERRLANGLELTAMAPDLHEAVRLAHNDIFRDHWGSEPRDGESWGNTVNHPLARPELSRVAVDTASGAVAGYQLASHDPDIALVRGFREGYTELLGVRREYRGRGIAQALLADAMRRFAGAGMDVASLDVDSENPTGALALYTKMGYRAVNQSMAWNKEL